MWNHGNFHYKTHRAGSARCMQEQETLSPTLLADVSGIQVALRRKELDLNVEERKGKRRGRKRRVKIRSRCH